MSHTTKPASRGGMTDLLRFLFCTMILLYHSSSFAPSGVHAPGMGGYIGVDFFFIISGVYLAMSANRIVSSASGEIAKAPNVGQDTLRYMIRRLGRIYPEYIIALLIIVIARVALKPQSLSGIPQSLLRASGEWTMLQQLGYNDHNIVGATWYLSALLIASLLLYPLARKYGDGFLYILAPLIFLALFGYTWQNLKTLQTPRTLMGGFVCEGLVRGIMEMALGGWVYGLARRAEGLRLKAIPRAALTLVELAIYVGILVFFLTGTHKDRSNWNAILLLALAQLITQSKLSFTDEYVRGKAFSFLGALSFDIYLGHRFWSINLNKIRFLAHRPYGQKLVAYILISVATALIIMYGARLLRRGASKLRNWAILPEQRASGD